MSEDDAKDHVECKHCTCLPSKAEGIDENMPRHFHHRHFNNWEKWITKRKKVHENLTKSLNRPAGDLLMNVSDEYRQIQEEKTVFEYSNINTYFDKYRGNPTFWKLPPGLAEKGSINQNPVYFANKTKIEYNEIPCIEHVATPNYVKNEKDIVPRNRNLFTTHHIDKYRDIFSSKLNKVESHRPECDDLIIIGEKMSLTETNKDIDVTQDDNDLMPTSPIEQFDQKVFLEDESRICVLINDVVVSNNKGPANNMKIDLFFNYTTDLRMPHVKFLKFENRGKTVVRFYWNRSEKFLLFRDLVNDDRSKCFPFYFNKNELLLVPGETVNFPIWFKSDRIGNYSEIWEIITKPKICSPKFKLIINMQGIVYPNNPYEKIESLKTSLAERVTNTSVRSVLNDILEGLKFKESETEILEFTEKELFESANQNPWSIEKCPKFLYNKHMVGQLKLFYKEIKLPCSHKFWDYSIDYLMATARKKDISTYVENQSMEIIKAKQKRMGLSIVTEEIDDPSLITATDRDTLLTAEGLFRSDTPAYQWLERYLEGLERPSMIINKDRLKYFTAYSIIRTYSFKMIDALAQYDNVPSYSNDCCPSFHHEVVNEIDQMPERLIFERFEDVWMDRVKLNCNTQTKAELNAMPKPESLKNIPITDTDMVYKTYFDVSDIDAKKERSRDASIIESSSTRTMTVKVNFDPFEEHYRKPKYSQPTYSATAYPHFRTEIDYQKYLIVYCHLSEAVDAMVDALETLKMKTVDGETLKELVKCIDPDTEDLIFFQEETRMGSAKVTEASVKSFKLEQEAHFQKLLDSYLSKNMHTKGYIVEGKKRKRSRDDSQPNYQSTIDTESMDSWSFQSHESAQPSVKSRVSAEMQTDEHFKESPSVLLRSETNLQEDDSDHVEEKSSEDVFYILQEEDKKSNV